MKEIIEWLWQKSASSEDRLALLEARYYRILRENAVDMGKMDKCYVPPSPKEDYK